jgi:hypothetical protein
VQRDAGVLEGGVAGQEWIDQDTALARVDAKAGMPEPSHLHAFNPMMILS